MSDDQQPNVVQLPTAAGSTNQERQREADKAKLLNDTRQIVMAALLSNIEYERHRLEIAKKLGLRVVFLDRRIDAIRLAISAFQAGLIPGSFCADDAGHVIQFHSGDLIEPTIKIAVGLHYGGRKYNQETSRYEDNDSHRTLLLLSCDGNFTVRHGSPSPPQPTS